MHELIVPLASKARAPFADRLRDPVVMLQVLGDRQRIGMFFANLAVDPLQKRPALGQVWLAVGPDTAHE